MKRWSWFGAVLLVTRMAQAEPDASIETAPLDREQVQRAILARHPEVRAAEARATAARAMVDAEGRLPPPEAMAQVWQVPLDKPYAVDRAGMIMIGLTQRFPAPGSLGAREEAREHEAAAATVMISEQGRRAAREAGHAFVEYAEASARRGLHADHERIERRILEVARSRHATGSALADAVRAEAELARTEADLTADATMERTARAQLNVLLGRAVDAKLGPARASAPRVPVEDVDKLVERALASRPELKAAAAETRAAQSELDAARRESKVPGFSLSALYFPPSGAMNTHAYGAGATLELPWLWGGAASRARAQSARLTATESARIATRQPIAVEVVTAHANVSRAADRLRVLERRALPAGKRAVDVTMAGYESGGTSLLMVLESRRSLVDVEMAMVETRAALEHALVDLEAAVGAPIATRPLEGTQEESHHGP